MSKAWMPFYVGDYLKDTMHLTTEQHGAYLLLLMAAWQNGGAVEEARAPAIARMTGARWKVSRDTLADLFQVEAGVWTHKRVMAELCAADEKSKKATESINRRWAKTNSKKDTDVYTNEHTNVSNSYSDPYYSSPSQSESKKEDTPLMAPPLAEQGALTRAEGEGETGKKPAAKRGTRLSTTWEPSEADRLFAIEEHGFTQTEVDHAIAEFRDHWCDQTGAKATKISWSGTWRNRIRWLANNRRPQTAGQRAQGYRPGPPSLLAATRAAIEQSAGSDDRLGGRAGDYAAPGTPERGSR